MTDPMAFDVEAARAFTWAPQTKVEEAMAEALKQSLEEIDRLRTRCEELEAMHTEEVAQAAVWAHGEATVKLVQQRDEWKAKAERYEKALRGIESESLCKVVARANEGAVIDRSCPTCIARKALSPERDA